MMEIHVVAGLLVLARVSAFVAFFSLFSQRQIPNLVKVGLAVGLSFFWYNEVSPPSVGEPNLIEMALLVAYEVVIGLVIAVVTSALFLPAKIAGAYVGQELGLSLAAVSAPGSPDSSTMLTRVFEALAVLVFFATNLHHFVILVMQTTFVSLRDNIQVLDLPTEALVSILAKINDYGIVLIAPVGILLMLVTLVLALLNKAAPTLNLFSVGMSIRSGFGVLCLVIFFPVILHAMTSYLFRIQEDIERLLLAF